jgi:hypothetical protein
MSMTDGNETFIASAMWEGVICNCPKPWPISSKEVFSLSQSGLVANSPFSFCCVLAPLCLSATCLSFVAVNCHASGFAPSISAAARAPSAQDEQ